MLPNDLVASASSLFAIACKAHLSLLLFIFIYYLFSLFLNISSVVLNIITVFGISAEKAYQSQSRTNHMAEVAYAAGPVLFGPPSPCYTKIKISNSKMILFGARNLVEFTMNCSCSISSFVKQNGFSLHMIS